MLHKLLVTLLQFRLRVVCVSSLMYECVAKPKMFQVGCDPPEMVGGLNPLSIRIGDWSGNKFVENVSLVTMVYNYNVCLIT